MILWNPDFVDEKIYYSRTLMKEIFDENYINSKLSAIYSEQNELNKK
jgi:hypothetical protein